MNVEIQQFLIGQKLLCILDSYIYLFALQYFLSKFNYKVKPSSHFWELTKLSLEDMDESLFYNDSNKFVSFHNFKEILKEFNSSFDGLKEILIDKKASKKEKDLELEQIYNNIGMIIRAYYDTLDICFNKDSQQRQNFIEKFFILTDETRFFKIYKERFAIPDVLILLPQTDSSMSDKRQNQIYHVFADTAFKKIPFVTTDMKKNFIESLAKYVDIIIVNTPCNGKTGALEKNIRYVAGEFNKMQDTEIGKTPLSQRILPSDNLGEVKRTPFQVFKGWYFYVTSI